MLKFLDTFLDGITMYKLVLYGLIGLLTLATIFGFSGLLPYSPAAILLTTGILLFVSVVANTVFAYVFEAPINLDSTLITALILALIITPIRNTHDLPMLGWAATLAIASKYIFAIRKKHIFNPVAMGIAMTALWLNDSATWWVGTTMMMPFVVVLGFSIVRKIRREDMAATFFLVAIIIEGFFTILHGGDMLTTLNNLLFRSSLFFFGFIMLTEPLTTPPTQGLQMIYAGLVGFLFSPHIHIGSLYSTPELALLVGNVFSYLVSPKQKFILHLKEKLLYGVDVVDFVFTPTKEKLLFQPGQYMEWTLPHKGADSRGNRRYFTIASSPTEDSLRLGVKFYPNGSSFKKSMFGLTDKTPVVGGSLAGDFVLPKDVSKKLVFIAGGIGITPFRSMIKYCIDTKQHRQIILLYANKVASEIAYRDIFEEGKSIGLKTVYTLTDKQSIPAHWNGQIGRITPEMIREEVPDFMERVFYLSGPHAMVTGYEEVLKNMGVPARHIKKDFFPGFV